MLVKVNNYLNDTTMAPRTPRVTYICYPGSPPSTPTHGETKNYITTKHYQLSKRFVRPILKKR